MGTTDFPPAIHLETVDSTNSWLLSRQHDLPVWTVVYTFNQTKGRGRRDRVWSSVPGDSLALSILVPALPQGVPATWIPLLTGSALVEVLRNLELTAAQAKWPNDILVGSRKLSGTLVQGAPGGCLVVGVGINLFSPHDRLPDPNATSLALEGIEIADVLESFINPLRDIMCELIDKGLALQPAQCVSLWSENVVKTLGTIGKLVEVVANDGSIRRGTADSLGLAGELTVRDEHGESFLIHAGDVFHVPRS